MRNQVSISSIVIVLLASLLSAGSAFGVVVTSPKEGFRIEKDTTYNLLLDGLVSPAVSNGTLRVTQHYGDFNNANPNNVGNLDLLEWVNIEIDGIVLATEHVYFNDNLSINREVDLFFQLTQAQMNNIVLAGGDAIVKVYTSPDVDKSLADSWFEAEISYDVIPEPATMTLFGLGGVLLRRSIRRRKA